MARVKPKARAGLTVVELDGEAVVYDEETMDLHHLNPTATIVFGLCDGTGTIAQMAEDIAGAFGVPREEVEPQIRALLRKLRRAGLLESSSNGATQRERATAR